jgi:hypothetical protein
MSRSPACPCVVELLRQHVGRRIGKAIFQYLRDGTVHRLAATAHHGGIGGILHKRVLEGVSGDGRRATHQQELSLGQPGEHILQRGIG